MDNTKISSVVAKKLLAENRTGKTRTKTRAEILADREEASRRRKQADAERARAPGRRDPTGVDDSGGRTELTRDNEITGY